MNYTEAIRQVTIHGRSPKQSNNERSVDLSNTMWAQRELINQLAGNACGRHKTKTTIKYRD